MFIPSLGSSCNSNSDSETLPKDQNIYQDISLGKADTWQQWLMVGNFVHAILNVFWLTLCATLSLFYLICKTIILQISIVETYLKNPVCLTVY